MYAQNPAGNALNYDGTDDNVQTSNVLGISGASARTVEFLFNADSFGASLPSVIIHWGYLGGSPAYRQSMIGVHATYLQVDGGNDNYSINYTFSTNTWYHIAFTYNSGTIKVYINGALNGTSTGHTWNTDNTVLSIVRGYFDWPLFDGNLDEVRIWNIERTQTQIQTTMNDTLSPAYYSTADSGLVAYYRFDEGTGGSNNSGVTSLPDLSASSLNGTLYNFALSGSSSNWIVSDAPLPVELTSFTATLRDSETSQISVALNWSTATEVNNYGFEIERASFHEDRTKPVHAWNMLGFMAGHGNSNSPKDYSFIDENPHGKIIKYRLKQIDTDGAFEYSKIIEIKIGLPLKYMLSQNYPNPFNPSTTISYRLPFKSNVKIEIFSILGQRVDLITDGIKNAGVHTTLWNASNLASGIYVIRINASSISRKGNFSKSIKTLLLR